MPQLSALREPIRLPALEAIHSLILALCQSTHRLPPGESADLALRLRGTALTAAEALLRVAAGAGAAEVASASRLLREVGHHLDLARRLGYLSLGTAAEVLEHQTRASLEVTLLVRALERSAAVPLSSDVRRVPAGPRRFRLLAALRLGVPGA